MERLLNDIYGECGGFPASPATSVPKPMTQKLNDFELLLARKPPSLFTKTPTVSTPIPMQGTPSEILTHTSHANTPVNGFQQAPQIEPPDVPEPSTDIQPTTHSRRRNWGFDMSSDYTEEIEGYENRDRTQTSASISQAEKANRDRQSSLQTAKSSLNPWVIAKLNAPVTQEHLSSSVSSEFVVQPRHDSHKRQAVEYNSSMLQETDVRSQQSLTTDDFLSTHASAAELPHNEQRAQSSFGQSFNQQHLSHGFEDVLLMVQEPQLLSERRNDFVSARILDEPPGLPSPPSSGHSNLSKRRQGLQRTNKPFVPPFKKTTRKAAGNDKDQAALPTSWQPFQRRGDQPSHPEISRHGHEPGVFDIAYAMDYEKRKEEATRQLRLEVQNEQRSLAESAPAVSARNSPHKSSYNSAIAALEQPAKTPSVPTKEPFQTNLPEDDPRAYLMRRQKSMLAKPVNPGDPPRMLRAKSTKLPMERILPEDELFPLVCIMPISVEAVQRAATALSRTDVYIDRGSEFPGLAIKESHVPVIGDRLHAVVSSWVEREMVEEKERAFEVEFTFGSLPDIKSTDFIT